MAGDGQGRRTLHHLLLHRRSAFTPIYNVGASLSNVKVGLFAWNGPATTSDLRVSFQRFHIFNGAPGFARP